MIFVLRLMTCPVIVLILGFFHGAVVVRQRALGRSVVLGIQAGLEREADTTGGLELGRAREVVAQRREPPVNCRGFTTEVVGVLDDSEAAG
jgi:hypothetical protein